jgi:hypothetical protein
LKERVNDLNIDFDFHSCLGKKYKHGTCSANKEKPEKQAENATTPEQPSQVGNSKHTKMRFSILIF